MTSHSIDSRFSLPLPVNVAVFLVGFAHATTSCTASHTSGLASADASPRSDARTMAIDAGAPDLDARALRPDASAPDAHLLAPDAGEPDGHVLAPDASEPCEPPLVDEGDACVGWRAIPPPPCTPTMLVRRGAEVAVRCPEGVDYALLPTYVWDPRDGAAEPIEPERDGPDVVFAQPIVVTLWLGDRIATHGDVYAHPAAWRTDLDGTWHETVPPPSAFVTMGAALGMDEALFVGTDAYVFVRRSRVHLGW